MRKIIGLVGFIISSLVIIAIIIANIEIFKDFFADLESDSLIVVVALYSSILWSLLYEPLVILLLSVIAMGSYSK